MSSKFPMTSSSFPKAAITFCPLYISSTYPVSSPSADCCPWKYRWECFTTFMLTRPQTGITQMPISVSTGLTTSIITNINTMVQTAVITWLMLC